MQTFDVVEAQADAVFSVAGFDGAYPIRARDIDWIEVQSVTLGVFHQGCRRVEAHGLVVEYRSGESGQVAAFQICAGVSNQSETGGVRFRESIQRKRCNGMDDSLLPF